MDFIRYHETEQLYEAWPYLQDLLENLSLDIMAAKAKGSMGTADEYIYTMVIGNKVLSDMPPTGRLSDSTENVAEKYRKVMACDRKKVNSEIGSDIVEVSIVISKLEIAYRRLAFIQRKVLELYYWEDHTWKEIAEILKEDKIYYSIRHIQDKRRTAIEKMTSILKITVETYGRVMKMVEGAGENK